jgi:type IV pilus assembly protein PilY1
VNWVRGQDNIDNENLDCTVSPFYPCTDALGANPTPRLTDVRASIHGDVLHSRPAVVNYNRVPSAAADVRDSDIYVFYGSNDGPLRAVKGGTVAATTGPDANVLPGSERWSFIRWSFLES